MLTNKDYCDYETCVALKELGYNQPSIAFYPCQDIIVDCIDSNGELYEAEYDKGNLALYSSLNNKNHDINRVQAPLLYEAQKWLREEKKIEVLVLSKGMVGAPYDAQVYTEDYVIQEGVEYNFYEEALLEGLKEAVKILKENETIHE